MAADLTAKLARLRLRTISVPALPDVPRSLGVERGAVTVKSGRRVVAHIAPPLAGPQLVLLEEKFASLPERDVVRLGADLARSLAEPLRDFDDDAADRGAVMVTTGPAEAAACLAAASTITGPRALGSMFAAAVYPILLLKGALSSSSSCALGRMLAALQSLGGSR